MGDLSTDIEFFALFLQWFVVLLVEVIYILFKFIATYLISFEAIVNEIIFLYSFSICPFLVYRKATDFYKLILFLFFFFFVTANCLLKHKAMDSEKHPDFLLFGGSRVGHGKDRDRWRQPKGKTALSTPTASLASQVQSPSKYISLCCYKCML
jgi:hypothetical protein